MATKLWLTLVLAMAASGCALVPKDNIRLDEARMAHARIHGDAQVALLVPGEARQADEALAQAIEAWSSLQDPALVDHLAYMAKQRAMIAAEAAKRVALEQTLEARRQRLAGERS